MSTPTYTLINQITLAAASSTVTFSSIPQNYKDLIFVVGNLSATASNSLYCRVNGDTGSNYSYVVAAAQSSSASSASGTTNLGFFFGAAFQGLPTSGVSQAIVQLLDYSATDKHKTGLARYGSAGKGETDMTAFRWANTSAITSLLFFVSGSASFNSGTTLSLYGVVG